MFSFIFWLDFAEVFSNFVYFVSYAVLFFVFRVPDSTKDRWFYVGTYCICLVLCVVRDLYFKLIKVDLNHYCWCDAMNTKFLLFYIYSYIFIYISLLVYIHRAHKKLNKGYTSISIPIYIPSDKKEKFQHAPMPSLGVSLNDNDKHTQAL